MKGIYLTKEEGRSYGLRGGKKHAQKMQVRIEGEYLSTSEIATRLGAGISTVKQRLAVLKNKDGPITWAALSETQR